MVGEKGVGMSVASRLLIGKKSEILGVQKSNSKFSTSVLEKTKARRKNVRDLRKSFVRKRAGRRKRKLQKPKQSLSYKELYKLGKQKKQFYLNIGGRLHISKYDESIILGDIVCFVTSSASGLASIGVVEKTKNERVSIVPLQKQTGDKTRTTYYIFKKFVMCRMIKQAAQFWRLESITIDTNKKTKITRLLEKSIDLQDLTKKQKKLTEIAKRYTQKEYYQIRKENVR